MVKRNTITRFLRKELDISSIPDASVNGVQVAGNPEVKKIAISVDASIRLFETAKKEGCQMILVHHGVKWKGQVNDIRNKRLEWLKKNRITLFAAHLPIDIHPTLGNNAGIAGSLGMKKLSKFGFYHGVYAGFYGRLSMPIRSIKRSLDRSLKTSSVVQGYGPKITKKVGIISGGGAFGIHECRRLGIDTLITGEEFHTTYHFAEECGINVVYAGHYATETVGVKLVAKLLEEKFNIETIFIDIPTGQ